MQSLNEASPYADEEESRTSETSFRRLTLLERQVAENVDYLCTICNETCKYCDAKVHCVCLSRDIRIPPENLNIQPREATIIRTEVVSNPPVTLPATRRERLLIFNLNEKQVLAKLFPKNKNLAYVVSQVKKFLQQEDSSSWEVFKFIHKEVGPQDLVGDVANSDGATHLSILTNHPNLNVSLANLLFEDIGPSPLLERAPTPIPPDLLEDPWQAPDPSWASINDWGW